MLPSQLREVLFRMAQMPAVEHRQPHQDKRLAMHKHNWKTGSKYGRMGRKAANLKTPVQFAGTPRSRKGSGRKVSRAHRPIGRSAG
jgi:hypothetical protein